MTSWFQGLTPPPNDHADTCVVRLRQLTAGFTLLLLATTWRLWIPQDVYPQIPFIAGLINAPVWLEYAAGVIWVIGFAISLAPARFDRLARFGLAAAVAGGVVLILFDQHRLQPWAYLSLLICIALLMLPKRTAVTWVRLLLISLYVHSAISKLDYSFLHAHGPELCNAAIGFLGLSFDRLGDSTQAWIALTLPLGELAIAITLWTRRFRLIGLWLSIAMHTVLLVALGPLGLNHKPAVLLWNAQFLLQNWLLFRERASEVEQPDGESNPQSIPGRCLSACGVGVLFAAIILPLLEPFGYFDHWPGWALYVSRPERVTVSVHVLSRDKLPEPIRRQTDPPRQLWCEIHLDRWSLETLNAPIYPQGRYRLAVALAIAEDAELGEAIRITIESPANRFTGKRIRREIRGVKNLRKELRKFTINAARR